MTQNNNPLLTEITNILGDKYSIFTTFNYYQTIHHLLTKFPHIEFIDIHSLLKNHYKEFTNDILSIKSINTIKLRLGHLASLANKLKLQEVTKYIDPLFSRYTKITNQKRQSNKLEEKRKEDYISWEEASAVFDQIPEDTFNNIQDKVIVGLYTRTGHVVRLDYDETIIFRQKEKYDPDVQNNAIVIRPKTATFHLKNYKTQKQYGNLSYTFRDKELVRLLNLWVTEFNKSKYLLVKAKNPDLPIGYQLLSIKIKDIFKRYTGKKTSNTLLRIAAENNIIENPEYQKLNLHDKIQKHEKQQHSFQTAHEYNKT